MYFTSPLRCTVDPWTTWVWTVWVHLYDFFFPLVSTRESTVWSTVGWIRRYGGAVDIDSRLYKIFNQSEFSNLNIHSLVPLLFKGQPHLQRLFFWCPGWKLVSLRILNSLRYWKIFNNYYQSQNTVTLELIFLKKNFWSKISDLPLSLICHMDIKKHKVLRKKNTALPTWIFAVICIVFQR